MPIPEALIVELSGDDNRFFERVEASIEFAKSHSETEVHLVHSKEQKVNPGILCNRNVFLYDAEKPYKEAFELLKSTPNAAFVSAGDTSLIVIEAVHCFGRPSHKKTTPVLAAIIPKPKGHLILVDVDASARLDSKGLVFGALVGSVVAETLFNKKPFVALVNIGEEIGKGLPEIHKAYNILGTILEGSFGGYIEPHELFTGHIDVAVTSGFIGNTILKTTEGAINLIKETAREECARNPLKLLLGALFARSSRILLNRLDWRKYCGAYLFGIGEENPVPIIVTHGRSDKDGFMYALERAQNPSTLLVYRKVKEDPTISNYLESSSPL
ncbi:MAG: hypothetical protein NT135_00440 [Candidatus Berkelbacteria bacterium]|nr:hypothetical protein [Candidatus Berkelbacteria bacterium]